MRDDRSSPGERLGPPPVEPMSDVSWARVERGLWARLDATETETEAELEAPDGSRGRWSIRTWLRDRRVWLVPAVAAAAVVLVLVLGTRDTQPPHPAVVTSGTAVGVEPSRVVSSAAPSSVSFGDAHIELAAESAIVMGREHGAPSVLLEQGTATFAVAPRTDRSPFIVRAGDTLVRVVGTRFSVARAEERVSVTVTHGVVEVQYRGRLQRVSAGQGWRSTEPDRVTPRATVTPREDAGRTDAASPEASPEASSGSPDTRHRTAEPDDAPDTRHRTSEPDDAHRTSAPDLQPRTPDTRSRTDAPDTARATYERLAALEARDPARALTGYLELSRGGSRWAAVALFAAGRLAADRGDPRAERFLTSYLRRFPSGANAEDARNLLARIQGDH